MSNDAVSVSFEFVADDLAAWWQFYSRHGKAARRNFRAVVLLFGVAAGLGGGLLGLGPALSVAMAACGVAFGWVFMTVAIPVHVWATVGSFSRGPAAEAQFGRHELRCDLEGIWEKTPASEHRHAWRAVQEVCETPAHVFLIVGGGSAYVVPKAAFSDPVEADGFVTRVKALLAPSK